MSDEGRRAAINLVRSLCDSPASLARLPLIRGQLSDKAKSANGKLRTLQAAQVDDSKWAVQLLEQSTNRVTNVQSALVDIRSMCEECRVLLEHADVDIRNVAIARRHLRATTRLMGVFTSIPDRARDLEDMIISMDSQLKEVYIEVRQLVKLRDKAVQQSSAYQDRNDNRLRDRLARHFDALAAVIAVLEKRIWQNIAECVPLASEDPATLVKTLEIIEMEDYEASKDFPFTLFASSSKETMMQRALNVIEEAIGRRFAQAFEDDTDLIGKPQSPSAQDHPSANQGLSHILNVGRELVDDLQGVADFVQQCFPSRFGIFKFFESRYQKWIYSRLLHSTTDVEKLSPADLLDCIRWIQEYRSRMEALGADISSSDSSASLLSEHVPVLMSAYLSAVGRTLSDWIIKVMQSDWKDTPTQEANGQWVTNAPQDLYCILNQQIDIAMKRELNGRPFLDVVLMCFSVISEFQTLQVSALNAQGLTRTDTYLCALLNNCQQCSDNTESIRDRCREHLPKDDEMEDALVEGTDEALSGFVRVGSVTVTVLATQVMNCISENVLPTMFTSEWLSAPDGEFADKIIATVSDFFGDYESWIASEFFFARLIQETIRLLVKSYIEHLCRANLDPRKPGVIPKLHCDYEALYDFFTNDNIGEYVPVKVVQSMIEHIDKIQSIFDCESGWIPLAFESIFVQYGDDRGVVLKQLLNLRSDLSSSEINQICDRFREKYKSSEPIQGNNLDQSFGSPGKLTGRNNKRNVLSSLWQHLNKSNDKNGPDREGLQQQ